PEELTSALDRLSGENKTVAVHAPGTTITTNGPVTLRRRDGSVDELSPGRYRVQPDGSWAVLKEPQA
ncbi:MAG: hypothetical protein V3V96_17425, partial [Acidiferrobacterales bacterium]